MLNDKNFIFQNIFPSSPASSSRTRRCQPHERSNAHNFNYYKYNKPHYQNYFHTTDRDEDQLNLLLDDYYLADLLARRQRQREQQQQQQQKEQEQRRRYEAAEAQRRAYLEAMERRRCEQAEAQAQAQEQRQAYLEAMLGLGPDHLLAIEQGRRQREIERERQRKRYEQEQEKERRYRAALQLQFERERELERQRLQEEEQRKRAKAKEAAEAAAGKREGGRRLTTRSPRSHPLYQIVQGPDGGLYRVFVEPTEYDNDYDYDCDYDYDSDEEYDDGETFPRHHGCKFANSYENDLKATKTAKTPIVVQHPSTSNLLFKDNHHSSNDMDIDDQQESSLRVKKVVVKPTSKKNVTFSQKKKQQQQKKSSTKTTTKLSSVLVAGVEDASDSECEEDFNDYWHNRRPKSGNWIEPIEGASLHL